MDLNLRWTTSADFDRLLDFYLTELVKHPDYIAHPELREGIRNDPTAWMPKLKTVAVSYFMDSFKKEANIRLAVLEEPAKVNGAKKSRSKKAAPVTSVVHPPIRAMVRIFTAQGKGTLLDILVAEDIRNKGWGTKLLAFIQQGMESEGISEMNLSVSVQNNDAARFFVRNGFMPYAAFFSKTLAPPPPRVHRMVSTSGFGVEDE